MLLANDIPKSENEKLCTVTIEGKITHSYLNYIPGVNPPLLGNHWIMGAPTIVSFGALGLHHDKNIVSTVGFWTVIDSYDLNLGDEVRVSLVPHRNNHGYLTLMPSPLSTYSITSLKDGRKIFDKHPKDNQLDPTTEKRTPYRYGWYHWTTNPEKWWDDAAFLSSRDIWMQAWTGGDPNLDIQWGSCTLVLAYHQVSTVMQLG